MKIGLLTFILGMFLVVGSVIAAGSDCPNCHKHDETHKMSADCKDCPHMKDGKCECADKEKCADCAKNMKDGKCPCKDKAEGKPCEKCNEKGDCPKKDGKTTCPRNQKKSS